MSEENKNLEEAAECAECAEAAVEEVKEAAEECVAEAAECAEECTEKCAECAEETAECAEEAAECAEEAAECAEEAAECAEECTEECAECAEEAAECAEEAAESVPARDPSEIVSREKDPLEIKKKGPSTSLIVGIIVLVVAVIACALFICWKNGVFHKKAVNSLTLESYESIEIPENKVEVTDEIVDSYMNAVPTSYSTNEYITEGVVEDGDNLYISYVGTMDGEVFAGGSTDGTNLVIGSGSYIEGFEEGLLGKEIGSTVSIDINFPDPYTPNPDYSGKPVNFEVTIINKTVLVTPELTDEFVKENSAEFFGEQLNTIADAKAFLKERLYNSNLETAIIAAMYDKATVNSYDEDILPSLKEYYLTALSYSAMYYGTDADTLAQMYYGVESADVYAQTQAEYYLEMAMIFNQVYKDLNITYTPADLDAALEEYMTAQGYNEQYTLEAFKEQSGDAWMYLYENIEYKFEKVLEELKTRVVITAPEEIVPEETTVAN